MTVSTFEALTNPGYGTDLTANVSVSSGDLILLMSWYSSGVAWDSGSDDDGNTYAEIAEFTSVNDLAIWGATATATNASLNVTFTMSSPRSGKNGAILVFAGGGTFADSSEATEATATTSHDMGSVSLSSSGLYIASVKGNLSANWSEGSTGWDASIAAGFGLGTCAYKEAGSGSKSGEAFTSSAARTSNILSIAIEASGGGGGGGNARYYREQERVAA